MDDNALFFWIEYPARINNERIKQIRPVRPIDKVICGKP